MSFQNLTDINTYIHTYVHTYIYIPIPGVNMAIVTDYAVQEVKL